MFDILHRFGFGANFISWVKLLYSSPLASVRTNDDSSAYFSLFRGTRQGCPLSPLLFNVVIEVLAVSLRQCSAFEGIRRGVSPTKYRFMWTTFFYFYLIPISLYPPF